MDFSKEELAHYARHFALPEFGVEGQKKLKSARVLVVGAGGLGSPMLLYLAAAGIGHIGIIDPDVVDESNLQRQVLYTRADIGQYKAEAAKKRLEAANPFIQITAFPLALTRHNALDFIKKYDIVADGTDNFQTRYLVNDACVLLGKPNVYASVFRYEGQVSVFNCLLDDGKRGPNYRDLFPSPPPPGLVPDCAAGGILGVLPGIIGSIQASEVLKLAAGIGVPLSGRLFLFDAASFSSRVLKFKKNPDAPPITELTDYDVFCGIKVDADIREMSLSALHNLQEKGIDYQLIDVREPYEHEQSNYGGELIPLPTLLENIDKISKTQTVILYCKTGKRSKKAIEQLQSMGFKNLFTLKTE